MPETQLSIASNNKSLELYALERLAASPLRVNSPNTIKGESQNASPKPITDTQSSK